MDLKMINDVADTFVKLKMYPYFDIANFALMSMAVREDSPECPGLQPFSRRHPFACWFSTMLMCFSPSILANFLIGESVLTPFKQHESIFLATAIWYLMNYSPFDIVYRLARRLPFKLVISLLKEVQRTKKVSDGVAIAYRLYPKAYLIPIVVGVVKGAGYYEMRIVERLVRGVWLPASNEFLKPSFATKASIGASIFFLLEKMGRIGMPYNHIYLAVVMFFIYFRISSLILGIHDPFIPFENLTCAVFMGGLVDALRRAFERRSPPPTAPVADGVLHTDPTVDPAATIKTNAEKKTE